MAKEFGLLERNFVDAMKDGLFTMGVAVDGPNKDRRVMQEIGKYFRDIDPDWWIGVTDARTQGLRGYPGIVLGDLRFSNELDWAQQQNFYTIRLDVSPHEQICRARRLGIDIREPKRSLLDRLLRRPDTRASRHISETALDDLTYRFHQVINTDCYDEDVVAEIVINHINELLDLETMFRAPAVHEVV